jgi:surfeit locus 1 family protein
MNAAGGIRTRVIVFGVISLSLAALFVRLGFWQLGRMQEKELELGRYARASAMSAEVRWPADEADYEGAFYRRSLVECVAVEKVETVAGHSASGETGWAHMARCRMANGGMADVGLGWSRNPQAMEWAGGQVGGFVGPYRDGVKLVAAPPQAGLEQLAPPDPRDMPNNHLSYAVQWFLFALTALVIYVLAVRKKWRATAA